MSNWTNKHWGAVIGGLLVLLVALAGVGTTALILLFTVAGYFVGKFLDGEIDPEDVRARAQGRGRSGSSASAQEGYYAPPPDASRPSATHTKSVCIISHYAKDHEDRSAPEIRGVGGSLP